MDQVNNHPHLVHIDLALIIELDSIGNARREINFFFPQFDFPLDLKNIRFDQFTFNKHTLEHQRHPCLSSSI